MNIQSGSSDHHSIHKLHRLSSSDFFPHTSSSSSSSSSSSASSSSSLVDHHHHFSTFSGSFKKITRIRRQLSFSFLNRDPHPQTITRSSSSSHLTSIKITISNRKSIRKSISTRFFSHPTSITSTQSDASHASPQDSVDLQSHPLPLLHKARDDQKKHQKKSFLKLQSTCKDHHTSSSHHLTSQTSSFDTSLELHQDASSSSSSSSSPDLSNPSSSPTWNLNIYNHHHPSTRSPIPSSFLEQKHDINHITCLNTNVQTKKTPKKMTIKRNCLSSIRLSSNTTASSHSNIPSPLILNHHPSHLDLQSHLKNLRRNTKHHHQQDKENGKDWDFKCIGLIDSD